MKKSKARWYLLLAALGLILLLNRQGKEETMALSDKVVNILEAVFKVDRME